jgi:hypothetical protein
MHQVGKVQLILLKIFYLSIGISFLYLMTLNIFNSEIASIGKSVVLAIVFLCFIGFFHPLKIIPLLLFSVAWKLIWLGVYVIPAYLGGGLDEFTKNILIPVSMGLVITSAVTPWRYVAKLYLASSTQA